MRIIPTKISHCYQIIPDIFEDNRGRFVKIFHHDLFKDKGLNTHFAEEYYTVSNQGVLRGLHFQKPPMQHTKMVYCVSGEVMDAVVDLRIGSPTFGRYELFTLDAKLANIIYIPPGLAHGFYVTSQCARLVYKVSTVYSPEHDAGILWNSAGIPWPEGSPTLSSRDCTFPLLADFESPFHYQSEQENG